MKLTKWHVLRLILSSLATVCIWKITTIMQMMQTINILEMVSWADEHGINMYEVQTEMIVYSMIWHYAIATLLIVATWKWFGLPRKLYTGQLDGLISYILPRYHKEE